MQFAKKNSHKQPCGNIASGSTNRSNQADFCTNAVSVFHELPINIASGSINNRSNDAHFCTNAASVFHELPINIASGSINNRSNDAHFCTNAASVFHELPINIASGSINNRSNDAHFCTNAASVFHELPINTASGSTSGLQLRFTRPCYTGPVELSDHVVHRAIGLDIHVSGTLCLIWTLVYFVNFSPHTNLDRSCTHIGIFLLQCIIASEYFP